MAYDVDVTGEWQSPGGKTAAVKRPVNVGASSGGNSMFPALIAAGASILGGVMSNRASARQASKQMRFQEEMSSTAHQREVLDLQAAGLNPVLSGTGGMGSSSAAGAAAQQHDVISPAINAAATVQQRKQDSDRIKQEGALIENQISVGDETIQTQKSQQELNKATTTREGWSATQAQNQAALLAQQHKTEVERTANEREQREAIKAQAALTNASAKSADVQADIDSTTAGYILRVLERVPGIGGLIGNLPIPGKYNKGR